jgi:uncharacterized membrane protein YbhN (UPF0104 family)
MKLPKWRTPTPAQKRALSLSLLAAVVVFSWLALRGSWEQVGESLRQVDVRHIVAAAVLGILSTFAMFRAWRHIVAGLHVGDLVARDARTMYYCGQLGKYVPGSVWPAVIQGEIGARHQIPRRTVLTTYALTMVSAVGVGGVFAIGTWAHPTVGWVRLLATGAFVGGVLLSVVFLHPKGHGRVTRWVIEKSKSKVAMQSLERNEAWASFLWTVVGWVLLGMHVVVLSMPFGIRAIDIVFISSSFALAWVVGLVAVPLPAGAGLRDAILIVTLGRLIGQPAAVSVAILSRLVMLINDMLFTAITGLPYLIRTRRERRSSGVSSAQS